jgi:hypothetical protein
MHGTPDLGIYPAIVTLRSCTLRERIGHGSISDAPAPRAPVHQFCLIFGAGIAPATRRFLAAVASGPGAGRDARDGPAPEVEPGRRPPD